MDLKNLQKIKGFTFVELSLVLLIVSFLLIAIAGGRSLLLSARLQSVISEKADYVAVYQSFRERYAARPGDMLEGYLYFRDSGCSDANVNIAPSGCNGNGDTRIAEHNAYEGLLAWRHLHLSGALDIAYDGIVDGENAVVSEQFRNVPSSDIQGGAWWYSWDESYGISSNKLLFARLDGGEVSGGIITPQSAEKIDAKIDDGRADSGDVWGLDGANLDDGTDCVSGTQGQAPANWVVADNNTTCRMMFSME